VFDKGQPRAYNTTPDAMLGFSKKEIKREVDLWNCKSKEEKRRR